ncbi:MAG: glycosyltransferase [Gammaproteobacteria bacterium]|nr:glycosyltransferase [Gammaproteobacteria bacterium]
MPDTPCVVVAGMHRSGTSLVAAMLADVGLRPLGETMPAHPVDNPGGYFESRELVQINNRFLASSGQTWASPQPLPGGFFDSADARRSREEIDAFLDAHRPAARGVLIKDPRLCRLLPLWVEALAARFDPLVFVRVIRRADAVFRSLARRAERNDTAKAAVTCPAQADLLWLHYNLELDKHTVSRQRFTVAYEDLMQARSRRVTDFLAGLSRSLDATVESPANPARRSQKAARDIALMSDRDRVCETVYQALLEGDDATLDAARRQLETTVPDAHQDVTGTDAEVFHRARLRHFVSKTAYRPVFPSSPRARLWRRPRRDRGQREFLFVSGRPRNRGHLYRVHNAVDALNRMGVPARWMSRAMLERHGMPSSRPRCVVIHRCPYDATIEQLLDRCRARGITVGFDIDDLIFDPELIELGGIRFIADLEPPARARWVQDARSYQRTMAAAAFCIVPTEPLADHARRFNTQVAVIENAFNPDVLALSDFWREQREANAVVRIGYASGTATHDGDFATIARPLAKALAGQADWRFTALGTLGRQTYENVVAAGQVEVRPVVEHVNLAYELARFDVNLIPLESNAFCDAKSPLKYFEAALTGTPTLAVRNPLYADLIEHGRNGLLAATDDEWQDGIAVLASDPGRRRELATAAREQCQDRFHVDRLVEKYLHLPI